MLVSSIVVALATAVHCSSKREVREEHPRDIRSETPEFDAFTVGLPEACEHVFTFTCESLMSLQDASFAVKRIPWASFENWAELDDPQCRRLFGKYSKLVDVPSFEEGMAANPELRSRVAQHAILKLFDKESTSNLKITSNLVGMPYEVLPLEGLSIPVLADLIRGKGYSLGWNEEHVCSCLLRTSASVQSDPLMWAACPRAFYTNIDQVPAYQHLLENIPRWRPTKEGLISKDLQLGMKLFAHSGRQLANSSLENHGDSPSCMNPARHVLGAFAKAFALAATDVPSLIPYFQLDGLTFDLHAFFTHTYFSMADIITTVKPEEPPKPEVAKRKQATPHPSGRKLHRSEARGSASGLASAMAEAMAEEGDEAEHESSPDVEVLLGSRFSYSQSMPSASSSSGSSNPQSSSAFSSSRPLASTRAPSSSSSSSSAASSSSSSSSFSCADFSVPDGVHPLEVFHALRMIASMGEGKVLYRNAVCTPTEITSAVAALLDEISPSRLLLTELMGSASSRANVSLLQLVLDRSRGVCLPQDLFDGMTPNPILAAALNEQMHPWIRLMAYRRPLEGHSAIFPALTGPGERLFMGRQPRSEWSATARSFWVDSLRIPHKNWLAFSVGPAFRLSSLDTWLRTLWRGARHWPFIRTTVSNVAKVNLEMEQKDAKFLANLVAVSLIRGIPLPPALVDFVNLLHGGAYGERLIAHLRQCSPHFALLERLLFIEAISDEDLAVFQALRLNAGITSPAPELRLASSDIFLDGAHEVPFLARYRSHSAASATAFTKESLRGEHREFLRDLRYSIHVHAMSIIRTFEKTMFTLHFSNLLVPQAAPSSSSSLAVCRPFWSTVREVLNFRPQYGIADLKASLHVFHSGLPVNVQKTITVDGVRALRPVTVKAALESALEDLIKKVCESDKQQTAHQIDLAIRSVLKPLTGQSYVSLAPLAIPVYTRVADETPPVKGEEDSGLQFGIDHGLVLRSSGLGHRFGAWYRALLSAVKK